jgi:hypothetical protein
MWVFPSARFLGAVLWSPVLGRRDLVSLVGSFSRKYSTKSQVVATVKKRYMHTQRTLGGSSFPSSSRVGSFGWTDQGRFILSVLVLGGDPQRVLWRVPCGPWSNL